MSILGTNLRSQSMNHNDNPLSETKTLNMNTANYGENNVCDLFGEEEITNNDLEFL